MTRILWKTALMVLLGLVCLSLPAPASAQIEEEMEILQMIYRDKDLVVTPSRTPKRISQVAENITVISAAEIEAINAHSLADVLRYVTGVQVDTRGGPGSLASVLIQGSDSRHVQVMVDGVSLNNLSDNFPETGSFPVQQIERVEIVKGPGSSAWGSSLGGVVNVITKSPDPDRTSGGLLSASVGERGTGDYRAETSGTLAKLGYYLYGGGFTSDGLTPHMPADSGSLYGKLQLRATEQLQVDGTVGYARQGRGDGAAEVQPGVTVSSKDRFEQFFTTLALTYAFSDDLNLNLSGRLLKQRLRITDSLTDLSIPQTDSFERAFNDTTWGGSAKVNWRIDRHNLLAGFDYDDGTLDSNLILDGSQGLEKWALFANDTITLGSFSVTPGLRYDHTSTNGDFVSPSIGITYSPIEQTTFRGMIARGFNTPPLSFTFGDGAQLISNADLTAERVWSYSVGLETAFFKYFWLKTTGFIHDIDDVISFDFIPPSTVKAVNRGSQRRKGFEAELRTIPVHNFSLSAGYTLLDVRDLDTDRLVPGQPADSCDLGLDYNDNGAFRGALRGHYIRWNKNPNVFGKSSAVIWDLNLARKVLERNGTAVEFFFTAHNLFNGSQYSDGTFPNPRRWFEGGMRCRF